MRLLLVAIGAHLPTYGAAVHPLYQPLRDAPSESFGERFVFDPVTGWRNRPGTTTKGGVTTTVDDRGLRAPSAPATRTPGQRRVAVVGDSFTFGLDVGDDDVWVARVDAALPDVELLNLGVAGYGVDQMTLAYEARADDLDVDLVVAGVLWLDLDRAAVDHFFDPKPRAVLAPDGTVAIVGLPVPDPDATRAADRFRSRALDIVRFALSRNRPPIPLDDLLAVNRGVLARLAGDVRAHGADLVVLALPAGGTTGDGTGSGWVRAICPDGVACVDLLDLGDLPLVPGGHWAPEGHARVAEAAVPVLLDHLGVAAR